MQRRDFTALTASALFTAAAGCLGGEDDPEDGGNGGTESSGTDSETTDDGISESENDDDETTSEGEDGEGESDGESESETQTVKYIESVSGHAIEVEYEDGQREVVRLAGIEAPSTNPDEIDPAAFFGDAFEDVDEQRKREFLADIGGTAGRFLDNNLWDPREREEVQLETDPQTPDTDEEGRRMVFMHWVSPYGRSGNQEWHLNRRLIGHAYARPTDTPSAYKDEFHDLADTARTNKTGYWEFQS